MHIPDGFLSPPVWIGMWIIAVLLLGYAIVKTRGKLSDAHIPLMGVLAAFIFSAQMLNVPIGGGTSGHLLGGVLAAILLGPWSASIVMAAVFFVQTLIFQDGGITALGANIFNMGLIGTILGYYVYEGAKRVGGKDAQLVGAGVAGWIAIVLASAACAIELAASETISLNIVLPVMVGIHAIIGFIEAGITVAVIAFISRTRPDLLNLEKI